MIPTDWNLLGGIGGLLAGLGGLSAGQAQQSAQSQANALTNVLAQYGQMGLSPMQQQVYPALIARMQNAPFYAPQALRFANTLGQPMSLNFGGATPGILTGNWGQPGMSHWGMGRGFAGRWS